MEKHYKHDPGLVVKPAFYSGGIPVFKPTMDQFQDFYKFNKAVNQYGMKSGIIKIIPPPEWSSKLSSVYTTENFESVVIRNPIVQNVNSTAGFKGVYSSQNVERQRKYSLSQWLELSKKPNYQPPAPKKKRGSAEPENHDAKTQNSRPKRVHNDKSDKALHMQFNIDVSEFTDDRCSELESMYWRSLGYAEPMYGADVLGSLFKDSIKCWNVAHLPNLLDLMDEKVPGVNDAYLYAGLWKATFSWHLEDQDLYSINYLHLGAPKQWYSISQKDSSKFYDLMKDIFNEDYKNCSEFLRHKTFLASPAFLEKNGISCNKIVHNQGEFIITYPYGYHAGFNYGYNLAESVNFALDEWFEFAAKTKKCECIKDSVGINSKQIFCKFKGIPYDSSSPPIKEEDIHATSNGRQPVKRKRAAKVSSQCVLCPISLPEKLLKFREFELLNCDATDPKTGNISHVHRICSEAFPQFLRTEEAGGFTNISGINEIPRSYRSLKCLHCRISNKYSTSGTSQGACFQCSAGTCSKSYHPICALSSGFLFNNTTCKVHRRSLSKFYERQNTDYLNLLRSVKKNSLIQFSEHSTGRRHTGEIQCGLVESNNVDVQSISVLLLPSLEQSVNVHFDDVLLGESTDIDNAKFWNMAVATNATVKRQHESSVEDEEHAFKKSSPSSTSAPSVTDQNQFSKKTHPKKEIAESNVPRNNEIDTRITPVKRHSFESGYPQSNVIEGDYQRINIRDDGFKSDGIHGQFMTNSVPVGIPHLQQGVFPVAPVSNIINQAECNHTTPPYINQAMPIMPPYPVLGGYNYTFQHPRSFSDSSRWLLPMARQAGPVFMNGYAAAPMQSSSEMGQFQFVPENI